MRKPHLAFGLFFSVLGIVILRDRPLRLLCDEKENSPNSDLAEQKHQQKIVTIAQTQHNISQTQTTVIIPYEPFSEEIQQQRRRRDDVDDLVSYLSECIFYLPEIRLREDSDSDLINSLPDRSFFNFNRIKLTNVGLSSIEQRNKKVEENNSNNNRLWVYEISIKGMRCDAEARFQYLPFLFENEGSATMVIDNGYLDVKLGFESEDFNRRGPNYVYVKECQSNFKLSFLSIDGNFRNEFYSFLSNMFISIVETSLGNGLCKYLNEKLIGIPQNETALTEALANYSELVLPYYDDVIIYSDDDWLSEPTYVSSLSLINDKDDTHVDLSDTNNLLGMMVDLLLEQVDTNYGAIVPAQSTQQQEEGDNGEMSEDLGINVYLRDNFLPPDGVFVWENETSFTLDEENSSENKANEITLTIKNIRVEGLDSFQELKLFFSDNNNANEITAGFFMDRVKVEAEIYTVCKKLKEINIKDYEGFEAELAPFVETTKIEFELKSFGADGATQVAFSEKRINELKLGGLLKSDSQLACLFYSLDFLNITMLNLILTEGLEKGPQIDRIIDPIVGVWFNEFVQFMVDLNQQVISDAGPNLVSEKAYGAIGELVQEMALNHGIEKCTLSFESFPENGLVDFRDLLLTKEEALALGGSGSEPYGSVVSKILIGTLLEGQILEPEEEEEEGVIPESPKLNVLIRDFTERNSTVQGKMVFFSTDTNSSIYTELVSDFQLGDLLYVNLNLEVFNVSVESLDSFQYPLEILEPSAINPHVLKNIFKIGSTERPLKLEVPLKPGMLFFSSDDDTGAPEEYNFKLTVSGSEFLLDNAFLATFSERKFMGIRALDIVNPNCFLAAISPASSSSYEAMMRKGLNLLKTDLSVDSLDFKLDCVTDECENGRLSFLPKLVQVLNDNNLLQVLVDLFSDMINDFLSGPYVSSVLHQLLMDSPDKCSNVGQSTPIDSSSDLFNLTVASEALLEEMTKSGHSFLIVSALTAYITIPIISTKILEEELKSSTLNDPLSLQNTYFAGITEEEEEEVSLLDLRFLNESLFNWFIEPIENFTSTITSYEVDPVTGLKGELGINSFVRDFENDEGAIQIDFTDIKIGNIEVTSVEIFGLDTFREITPYVFEGAQTFSSSFQIEVIKFKVGLSIESRVEPEKFNDHRERELMRQTKRKRSKTETMDIIFSFRDVQFYSAVFLAIIEEKLVDLQLGSILDLQNAISCLNQVLVDIAISQLDFSVSGWDVTTEGGDFFLEESPEILRALQNSHKELMSLFEDTVTDLIPFFSDKILRPWMNQLFQDFIFKQNTCQYFSSQVEPESTIEPVTGESLDSSNIDSSFNSILTQAQQDLSMFVDLRDLFLKPEDSIKIGGSGEMPYGDLWFILANAVRDNIMAPNPDDNNSPKVNARVDSLTEEQSGMKGQIIYPDPLVDIPINLGAVTTGDGILTLKLFYNNFLENLASFAYPMNILDPKAAFEHRNIVSMGGPQEGFLKGKTFISMNITYPDGLSHFVELALDLEIGGIQLDLLILTKILIKRLKEFPLVDVNNIHCWLTTIPAPELDEFGVRVDRNISKADRTFGILDIKSHFDNTNFRSRCTNCDQFEPLRDISPNYPGQGEGFSNFVDVFGKTGLTEIFVDRQLYLSKFKCPHDPLYNESHVPSFEKYKLPELNYDSTSAFYGIFFGILSFYSGCNLFRFLQKRLAQKRHNIWLLQLSDNEIIALYTELIKESCLDQKLSLKTNSLVASREEIPFFIRFMTPLFILGNVGLFISGHMDVGARVLADIHIAGKVLPIREVYTFSMLELVESLWTYASKPLAALVAFASIIWPYSKQSITLFMWITPPSLVSPRTRGNLLETLDSLGKWSIIDIFIIVIASLAFRLTLTTSYPERYIAFEMFMKPLWGLFANLLAQIVSQISSHWIIHYQRKVIAAGLEKIKIERQEQYGFLHEQKQQGKNKNSRKSTDTLSSVQSSEQQHMRRKEEALCDHKFILGGSRVGQKLHVRRVANIAVGLFGCLTIVMIFAGSSVQYLQLEHSGLVYFALDRAGKESVINYSVLTTASELMNLASYVDQPIFYVGFFALSFLLVVTCTVVPILQALMALWLWFIPMTIDRKRKLMWYIEIVKAWQYTEVFFLGCVIMMWQTGQISEGIMNALCRFAQDIFRELSGNGVLEEKHARCWHINATLRGSVSVHIISTMMLWILSHFIEMAYDQHVRDHRVSDIEGIDTEAENEDIMTKLEQNKEKNDFFTEILSHVKSAQLQFTDYYTNAVSLIIKHKGEEEKGTNKSVIISTGIELEEKKIMKKTNKKKEVRNDNWINDADDQTTDLFDSSFF